MDPRGCGPPACRRRWHIAVFLHRTTVLSEKDTVVLADFANSTGDPVFDETLRQGMAVQLEQSPFLSLISDQRIQHTLRLMGRGRCAAHPELAREICERTGSAAVLEGSIATLEPIRIGVTCKELPQRQTSSMRSRCRPTKKEDVLNALSQIASKFRTRVGESLVHDPTAQHSARRGNHAVARSLKAYSAGLEGSLHKRFRQPLCLFSSALPRSIPISQWHMRRWGACTLISMSPISRRRAPAKPGSCGTAPVIGRSSSSLLLTKTGDRKPGAGPTDL